MANTTKHTSTKRRKALKLMLGTSALTGSQLIPEKWARPVISTAILPGHAQASSVCTAFRFTGPPTVSEINNEVFYNLEIETFGVPDGSEVEVNVRADNNEVSGGISEFEGTIETEDSEGFGYPDFAVETTLLTENNPTGTVLEAEAIFEGSPLASCNAEATVVNNS